MTERTGYGKYLKIILTTGDFFILNLAYVITILVAGSDTHFLSKWVWLIANVSFIPSVLFYSGIHNDRILYADRVVLTSFKSMATQGIVMLCLLYIFDIFDVSNLSTIFFFGLFWLLLSVWWVFARWVLKSLRRKGLNFKRTVIVGTGSTASMLLNELHGDAGYGYRILGIFDVPSKGYGAANVKRKFNGFEVLNIENLQDFCTSNKVDLIYFTRSGEEKELITDAMRVAEELGADFVYLPQFDKVLSGQFRVGVIGSMPSMVYTLSPLHKTSNKLVKRALDLAISVPFLIVSPIIFLPIAIGIKITSPGPVFFKQKRTGYRGKEFVCYKFRTMHVNVDSDKVQATKDDPRKTKFGDFLRRSSLDELPQFINVLLGNMSVVGPRPHMLLHTEEYSALIDKYMVRHAVKPGITGWAQVNGYRGGTKHLWQMEKRVEYDVWYIRHWNLMLDIKIIFLTAFNSLRSDNNAY